jgi:type I restriction enzyme S subunit
MAGSAVTETKALHVPAAYGEPPDGWTWSRLDDVSEGVFDCPHSTPKLTDAGPFVVRTQDIITGVFRADQAARVSEETYAERIARVTPSRGDLLYSREGTYFGIAAEVPAKTPICLGQRMVLIRPDKRRLDFSFLRHWLNSPIMAAHIHGYRDGSVAERLNLPTIRALPILIPPLAEQKAIAAVLGALDDKIELNRRMIATLEAMARALFHSWFVDFDPVRAKLDERKPVGMDAETAALFPDTMDHDNGATYPTGWSRTNLGDEVDLITGFPFQSRKYTEVPNSIRLVRGDNVVQGRLRWDSVKRWPTEMVNGLDDYYLQSGDVVLAMDRPWIEAGLKRACIAEHDMPCLLVQRVARLRDAGRGIGPGFVRMLTASQWFTQYILSVQTGTTVPHISSDQIKAFSFFAPMGNDRRLLKHFENVVAPLLLRCDQNQAESETLATLRDTLLPKLLSGELKVGVPCDNSRSQE